MQSGRYEMNLKDMVLKNRSYRRFYNEKKISKEELTELVDIARNTPSAANRQPVRYKLVYEEAEAAKVYKTLGWAGYLKDWDGPIENERPAAYIILATDKDTKADIDEGIISQTIMLAAVERGLGGCILGNVKREELVKAINLPADYKIDLVLALGYPKENVSLVEMQNNDVKYYRDEDMNHYVPKRRLEDVLLK